jgi:hypothetical protein
MRAMDHGVRARAVDEAQSALVLEVKARRRAWSNRQLLSRAPLALCGLSVPVRRSGLGWAPITAEDVEARERELELEFLRVQSPRPRFLSVASGPQDISSLFAGADDEDEEEEEQSEADSSIAMSELEKGFGSFAPFTTVTTATPPRAKDDVDLELGMRQPTLRWDQPPSPPRATRESTPEPEKVAHGLSLLLQPLPIRPPPVVHAPLTKMTSSRPRPRVVTRAPPTPPTLASKPSAIPVRTPVPAPVAAPAPVKKDESEEFTLAMDLPLPVTASRGNGRNHGRRRDREEWLSGMISVR